MTAVLRQRLEPTLLAVAAVVSAVVSAVADAALATRRRLVEHRSAVLQVPGLILLSVAAWDWLGRPAGLAAFGVSAFIVEALTGDG